MKKLSSNIVFVLLIIIGCSPPNDSLQLKIQKIDELQKKAKFPVNPNSFTYLEKADSIIKATKNLPDSIFVENIFSKGYCYYQHGKLDSANVFLHQAIDLIDNKNTRKRELVYYRNFWEVNFKLENYGNIVATANKFIREVDTSQNYEQLKFAYNALEQVNLYLMNYKKSLLYNDSVQDIATKIKDRGMSLVTSASRASNLLYLNKRDSAFELMDSILKSSQFNDPAYNSLEDKDAKRQFYREYGIIKYYSSDLKGSIENFKKSLSILKTIKEVEGFEREILQAYANIADTYLETKNYQQASTYLDSASTYVNANTTLDNLSFLNEIRLKLRTLNDIKTDELLTDYYALFNNLNKIHEQKINKEIFALKAANEKEKQLLQENKQNEISNLRLKAWILIIVILTVLLSVIGLLFYRQKKLRFEKNDLLLQQRLLRSQMNPHFTFNALYAIKNHIANDQKTATTYLLKFSKLLRLILENSIQNFVELESELELLEKYMELQLLRFPEKFSYQISLKNMEREDLLFIPPMLLQPFIENSIEHGFMGIDYKGHVDISLERRDLYILCSIADNGKGMEASISSKKQSTSVRLISDFILKSTKTPIKMYNKSEVKPHEHGVVVEFSIPYKLTEND